MEILLFFSIGLVGFVYFGYPLSLILVSRLVTRKVVKAPDRLPLTLIITAFNEEARIRDKLENTIALDYPAEVAGPVFHDDRADFQPGPGFRGLGV